MDSESVPGRPWKRLAAAAGVGVVAGFLAGIFGVGGGIVVVPGLVLLLGMGQRLAHGTSLAAIILIALAGVGGYVLEDAVDWPVAAFIVAGGAVGAFLGARALQRVDATAIRYSFAALALLAAVRLLVDVPDPTGREAIDAAAAAGLVGVGLLSGLVAGFLGVGGGIITVPALVILFSIPPAVAKGTSLLAIIPIAALGTVVNIRARNADLPIATAVGIGGGLSAFAGARVAVSLDATVSSVLFAALLVAVGIRMLVRPPGSRATPEA